MRTIERRLRAIEERTRPRRGVRYFTGYEASSRYYELGSRTPNYRFGLNREDEAGDYFTQADIAELERQGWECNVITICYVENWRDSGVIPLATVQPGMIDALL